MFNDDDEPVPSKKHKLGKSPDSVSKKAKLSKTASASGAAAGASNDAQEEESFTNEHVPAMDEADAAEDQEEGGDPAGTVDQEEHPAVDIAAPEYRYMPKELKEIEAQLRLYFQRKIMPTVVTFFLFTEAKTAAEVSVKAVGSTLHYWVPDGETHRFFEPDDADNLNEVKSYFEDTFATKLTMVSGPDQTQTLLEWLAQKLAEDEDDSDGDGPLPSANLSPPPTAVFDEDVCVAYRGLRTSLGSLFGGPSFRSKPGWWRNVMLKIQEQLHGKWSTEPEKWASQFLHCYVDTRAFLGIKDNVEFHDRTAVRTRAALLSYLAHLRHREIILQELFTQICHEIMVPPCVKPPLSNTVGPKYFQLLRAEKASPLPVNVPASKIFQSAQQQWQLVGGPDSRQFVVMFQKCVNANTPLVHPALLPNGRGAAVKKVNSTSGDVLMELAQGPHICKLLFKQTGVGISYYAMELLDETLTERVAKLIAASKRLPLREVLQCAEHVLLALQSLVVTAEKKAIIHRDLKPHNLMISFAEPDREAVWKLIDLGESKVGDTNARVAYSRFVGTDAWKAPEIHKFKIGDKDKRRNVGTASGQKIDIFSAGLVFYFALTTGKHPYWVGYTDAQATRLNAQKRINADQFKLQWDDLAKVVGSQQRPFDNNLMELIKKMLAHDPNARPTVADALLHPALMKSADFRTLIDIFSECVRPSKPKSGPTPPIDGHFNSALRAVMNAEGLNVMWCTFSPAAAGGTIYPMHVLNSPTYDALSGEKIVVALRDTMAHSGLTPKITCRDGQARPCTTPFDIMCFTNTYMPKLVPALLAFAKTNLLAIPPNWNPRTVTQLARLHEELSTYVPPP